MDNFEDKQSKYGKIYKVAGPRKSHFSYLPDHCRSFHEQHLLTTNLTHIIFLL